MGGGRHLIGVFVGGFGVAAMLRVAFKDGGGALLLAGLLCLAAGAYLIFRAPDGPSA